MSNIIFKNITKRYEDEYGLLDFDCHINSGEFITVIGTSGAGKSTFLKLISGLLKPDYGELYIEDELVNDRPASKRDVAMMFQEYVLYPNYNVYENVGAYLRFNRVSEDVVKEKVMHVLSLFNIENLANRRIKELSGGQQQRVALAKLFVRSPKIILFDEPLSNVSEENKNEYKKNILNLKKMLPKTTFIYVTHSIKEALYFGERVMVIEKGRNVAFTKPADLVNFPPTISILEMINNMEEIILIEDKSLIDDFYRSSIKNTSDIMHVVKNNKDYLAYNHNFELLGGGREKVSLEARLLDGKLKFNTFEIELSEVIKKRLLKVCENVNVVFDLNKFHLKKAKNDLCLRVNTIEKKGIYTLVNLDEQKFIINNNYNLFDKDLFYNIDDLGIYTSNGEKILANYIIYPNVLEVTYKGKNAFINKDKICLNNKTNSLVIPIGGLVGITNKKGLNHIKITSVLSEEIINDNKKLIYVTVLNAEHYLTFYVNLNNDVIYKKNKYIIIE